MSDLNLGMDVGMGIGMMGTGMSMMGMMGMMDMMDVNIDMSMGMVPTHVRNM